MSNSLILKHLNALNYRNIGECDLAFSGKINCFLGSNGMGKTNLLDIIYFLCFTKSSLTAIDTTNIRHQQEYMMAQGLYLRDEKELTISATVRLKGKKHFACGSKAYSRMADHIGLLPAVLISPDDIELINEGSEVRRKFVDGIISQYDRLYLQNLLKYNAALLARNTILKQMADNPAYNGDELLSIYEEQIELYGTPIYEARQNFITLFEPLFNAYYHAIAGEKEKVTIGYKSHFALQTPISEQLKSLRQRDIAIGYTTHGVHKDDIEMTLGGYPIRRIGSQGQNKTFVVALKFAQYKLMSELMHVKPLLLLDDIFDRLDSERVANIIKQVSGPEFGQIFITDTNRLHINTLLKSIAADSRIFEVANGQITSITSL